MEALHVGRHVARPNERRRMTFSISGLLPEQGQDFSIVAGGRHMQVPRHCQGPGQGAHTGAPQPLTPTCLSPCQYWFWKDTSVPEIATHLHCTAYTIPEGTYVV